MSTFRNSLRVVSFLSLSAITPLCFLPFLSAGSLAHEFNCNIQAKDSGIGFEGNHSKDLNTQAGPVEVLRIFPVKNWSRYRCRSCYSGRKTGKLFCSCHIDSNKRAFDVSKMFAPSAQGRFGTTVCRYCISVGEKNGYSTMCYCKDINAPDKPAPKIVKSPTPKVVSKSTLSKQVVPKKTAKINAINKVRHYGEYSSISEDTTIINNYYGKNGAGDRNESLFQDEPMPSYADLRPCDPSLGPCSVSGNNREVPKKYHQQDIDLASGSN